MDQAQDVIGEEDDKRLLRKQAKRKFQPHRQSDTAPADAGVFVSTT